MVGDRQDVIGIVNAPKLFVAGSKGPSNFVVVCGMFRCIAPTIVRFQAPRRFDATHTIGPEVEAGHQPTPARTFTVALALSARPAFGTQETWKA